MTGRLLAALLAVVTVIRLGVAAWTPMTPDEAYYWVWSRALAWGYLDHPPMVALWIRAGTWLVGQGPLGVRLLGPLSALVGSWLLYGAAISLGGDRVSARWAVVLLNATLLFGAGAVTMTPDTPLLFFWTATLWAVARIGRPSNARHVGAWWLAAGAAAGLAMCSKYTAVLLPAGIGLWLLVARDRWRWLLRPWPWLGAAAALGLFVPTLLWNAGHGWVSLAKQGGRGTVFSWARLPAHVGELVAGQVGLATPVTFILCVAGIVAAVRAAWRRDAAAALLACLTVPAMVIFVEHAFGDRVQANWPAIIYPGAAIAAARLSGGWRRWFAPAAALGAVLTAVVYVQGVAAPLPLPRRLDPSLRLAGGYQALTAEVVREAARRGAGFIAADDYGSAALLAFMSPTCIPVVAIAPRWALFRLPPAGAAMDGRIGLLLRSVRRHDPVSTEDWIGLAPVATIDRARGGRWAERYVLYQGTGRAGAAAGVVLPCRPATQPN